MLSSRMAIARRGAYLMPGLRSLLPTTHRSLFATAARAANSSVSARGLCPRAAPTAAAATAAVAAAAGLCAAPASACEGSGGFGLRSLGYHDSWADAFNRIDVNNDGRLQKAEVRRFLEDNHVHISNKEFEAMWETATAEGDDDDDSLTKDEWVAFMDRSHQTYAMQLWRSMKADPSIAGSVMYLGGSMLFAMMPYFKSIRPEVVTKCGQLLYITGGTLFLSICVGRHTDRVRQQKMLSDMLLVDGAKPQR